MTKEPAPLGEPPPELLTDSAEELFEHAPCGYLSTAPDGRILRVNQTFLSWTGHDRDQLLGGRRFQDLLTGGGRIYHETHYAPLLSMQGKVREIALEIVCQDGSRLPVLVNSTLVRDDDDQPRVVRTTVFNATDRRAYERELVALRDRARSVAEILQRSMLESPAPDDARFGAAVFYQPGQAHLEVGGDWHDVFTIGSDRVGLVVGDVVGRGIEAASAMGRLRSATRALALAGLGPSGVLECLDLFVEQLPTARSATVAYVEVDLETGEAAYACAGHPPPILLAPESPAQLLWDGRSAPLGAYGFAMARPHMKVNLQRGARVLLYTDGAVERRGEHIDRAIEKLAAEAAERFGEPVEQLVDGLSAMVTSDAVDDDVCLLAFVLGAA